MQYVVSLLFVSLCYFLITRLTFFNTLCMFVFCFVYCMFFCIVLCIVSPFVYSCLPSIFVQVYRPVNKCHVILMMVMVMMMMMMMKSLTNRDEIFTVEQKGICCVLLGHACL